MPKLKSKSQSTEAGQVEVKAEENKSQEGQNPFINLHYQQEKSYQNKSLNNKEITNLIQGIEIILSMMIVCTIGPVSLMGITERKKRRSERIRRKPLRRRNTLETRVRQTSVRFQDGSKLISRKNQPNHSNLSQTRTWKLNG